MSLTSAIASSFIHSFASTSIRPSTRKQQQASTVVPTDLNTTMASTTSTSTTSTNATNARDVRDRTRTGFLNPLALHPISSPSPSGQSRTRGYNPYDADNELVHIEYPNLSDANTNSPTLKQQRNSNNNIPGATAYFDQQQRSPKSISSPHGPPQLHARPRSAVSVKRGLGLSAIGGIGGVGGTTGLGVGVGGGASGVTLLRETIHEEEDSGFSDDSV